MMNKAALLFDSFGKVLETRDGITVHTKNCVEIFISEFEKLCHEFKDVHAMAKRLQAIREDLQEL